MTYNQRSARRSEPISWWKRKPGNLMQNANLIISSIAGVASIVLACWALELTYRYGESTTQIEALTKIASKQQEQLSQLKILIIESRRQTGLNNKQNNEMIISNTSLSNQAHLLSNQLSLMKDDQILKSKSDSLQHIALYNKLKKSSYELDNLVNVEADALTTNERLAIIQKVKDLLQREMENTYLINHSKIFKLWYGLYNYIVENEPSNFADSLTRKYQIEDIDKYKFKQIREDSGNLYQQIAHDIIRIEEKDSPNHLRPTKISKVFN
jgi:hypothetical protein